MGVRAWIHGAGLIVLCGLLLVLFAPVTEADSSQVSREGKGRVADGQISQNPSKRTTLSKTPKLQSTEAINQSGLPTPLASPVVVLGSIPTLLGGCDDDQNPDAGEILFLLVGIENTSGGPYTDLRVSLASTGPNSAFATVVNPDLSLGPLADQDAGALSFGILISPSAPARTPITFTASVTSPGDGLNDPVTLGMEFFLESDDHRVTKDKIYTFDDSNENWMTFQFYPTPSTPKQWFWQQCALGLDSETQQSGLFGPEGDELFSDGGGIFKTGDTCTGSYYRPCLLCALGINYSEFLTNGDGTTQPFIDLLVPGAVLDPSDGAALSLIRAEVQSWSWYQKIESELSFWNSHLDGLGFVYWGTGGSNSTWQGASQNFIPLGADWEPGVFAGLNGPEWVDSDNFHRFNLVGWEDLNGSPSTEFAMAYYWITANKYSGNGLPGLYGWGIDDVSVVWEQVYAAKDQSDHTSPPCSGLGAVAWTRTNHLACRNAIAELMVLDPNGGSSVQVHVSSAADPVGLTVTLNQDGVYSELYIGTVPLTTTPNQPGELTVGSDEDLTLVATYNEESPLASHQAFASTTCTQGAVIVTGFNVDPVDQSAFNDGDSFADHGELLSLNFSLLNLGVFDATGVKFQVSTDSPLVDCFLDDTALVGTLTAGSSGTNQSGDFVTLRIKDGALCTDPVNPGFISLDITVWANEFPVSSPPSTVSFLLDVDLNGTTTITETVDFETGLPFGWSMGTLGDNEPVDGENCSYLDHTWHLDTLVSQAAATGYGDGTYLDQENSGLTSPPLQITGGSTTLTFEHVLDIEPTWDGAVVEYRTSSDALNWSAWDYVPGLDDDGMNASLTHWTCSAWPEPASDPYADNYFNGVIGSPGVPVTATSSAISVASNDYIQLRWHWGTDVEVNNFAGWMIDNIQITNVADPVYVCQAATLPGAPDCSASLPGAVLSDPSSGGLTWLDQTSLDWGDVSGADEYALLRGGTSDLPGLLTGSDDHCERYRGIESTFLSASDSPSSGELWWYLAVAANAVGDGSAGASSTGANRMADSTGGCP